MKLTDQQHAAIHTVDRHLAVDAGAGSGKTFVLVQRILHLVEAGHANLDEIVAITFTDLAAAEMRDRLRETFRKKAESPEAMASPERQSFWRSLQRRAETARISTIHAFCASLLREQALRSGLDPGFAVFTEADAALLLHEVVRDTLHARMDAGDASALAAAVEFGPRPLHEAVIALVRRRYEIRRTAGTVPMHDPEALAAFWRASVPAMIAANLEAARSDHAMARSRAELEAFDGLCDNNRDGREVLRLQMLETLGGLYGGEDAEAIRRRTEALSGKRPQHRKNHWPSPEAAERLKAVQDDVKARFESIFIDAGDGDLQAAAELSAALFACFDAAASAYDAAKAERNALDFDDLIHRALELLDDPSKPVLRRMRAGVKHLLVDEFQDTDDRQYRIAALLSRIVEARRDGEDGATLFIVGDAKQSIYGWRGADVEVFKRAQAAMPLAPLPLNTNFRSSPQVLAFVNDFFRRSGALTAVEQPYVPMRWHRAAAADPGVEILLTPVDSLPQAKISAADVRELEAGCVAGRIAELIDPVSGLDIVDPDTGEPRKAQARDVAVLFRGRGAANAYERALQRRGVPYVLEAGPSFYERQEVADLRNLLAVVADPWNEAALLAFLRSPACAMDDSDILRLGASAPLAQAFHGGGPIEGLGDPGRLEAARALYRDLRARRWDPLPDFVDYVIDRAALEAVWLAQFMGVQKAANVRKVAEMAEAFSAGSEPGLGAFIRYLENVFLHEMRESEAGLPPGAEGAVTLMTTHKSKGLEFPIVILANPTAAPGGGRREPFSFDARWGLSVPPRNDEGKAEKTFVDKVIAHRQGIRESAEEMRILYVAMTRARDYLVLPGFLPGEKAKPPRVSIFGIIASVYDIEAFAAKGEMTVTPDEAIPGLAPCRIRIARAAPHSSRREGGAVISAPPEQPADWNAWRARLEPLAVADPARRFFAVTAVAKAMAGQSAAPSASEPATSGAERGAAMARGTIVHAVLERWDFTTDPALVLDEILALHAPAPKRAEALRDDLLPRLRDMAGHALARRIAADGRWLAEAVFTLSIGDAFIEGSIDALLSDGTIIDFKTGGRHGDLEAAYAAQVRLYALAAQRLRGVAPTEGLLWYIERNEVQAVDLTPESLAAAERDAAEAVVRLRNAPIPVDGGEEAV